jgi:predicted nucleotidyltransferase
LGVRPVRPRLGDDDRRQLDDVLTLVRDVLGFAVVGTYQFGSAVLGGLKPRSDLDVFVVASRATTRQEKQRLVDRLLTVSGRGGRRHVELTIVVDSDLKPWRYPPHFDFQYGDWLRGEFETGNLEPWATKANGDVATLITMVRRADAPLVGPPPADVLDPVPSDDLVRAMVESLDSLLDDLDSDTRNVILTLNRIWSTVAAGEMRSKDAAADWALPRLPREHRAVLARARSIYVGDEDERWDDLRPLIRPHAEHVIAEIERVRPG